MTGSYSYFHGGVRNLPPNAHILPPSETGAPSLADYGAAHVCARDRVYLTTDRIAAELYACMYPPKGRGWVYEVEPVGVLEADPDWSGEEGGSVQVPRARIVRVVKREVRTFQGLTMRQCLRRLLTPDGDPYAAVNRLRGVA